MTTRALVLVLAAVSAVGLLLVLLLSGDSASGRPPGRSGGAGPSTGGGSPNLPPDDSVAQLQARVAMLEARERARSGAAVRSEGAEREAARRTEENKRLAEWMDANYTPEKENAMFDAYFADLDGIRRSEPVDERWAAQAQATIAKLLTGKKSLAGSTIKRLECGQTLCRLETQHAQPAARDRLLGEIMLALAKDLPEASASIPVGQDGMTVYFARKGATLPTLDMRKYLGAP